MTGFVRDLAELEAERDRLREEVSAADWYIRCLEGVAARTPVRGLAEAKAAYEALSRPENERG
jgi:hypothetical protein